MQLSLFVKPNFELLNPDGNLFRTVEKVVPALLNPMSLYMKWDAQLKHILTQRGFELPDLDSSMMYNHVNNASVFSFGTRKDLPNYLQNLYALHTLFQEITNPILTKNGQNISEDPAHYAFTLHPSLKKTDSEKTRFENIEQLARCFNLSPLGKPPLLLMGTCEADPSVQKLLNFLARKKDNASLPLPSADNFLSEFNQHRRENH